MGLCFLNKALGLELEGWGVLRSRVSVYQDLVALCLELGGLGTRVCLFLKLEFVFSRWVSKFRVWGFGGFGAWKGFRVWGGLGVSGFELGNFKLIGSKVPWA